MKNSELKAKEKDLGVKVETLVLKRLGTVEAKAYKKHIKDCANDCEIRVVTTSYLSTKMLIQRTKKEKPVFQELDKLNHLATEDKWLSNIDKSILPLLK